MSQEGRKVAATIKFPVKRALISCYEKSGLEKFSKSLINLGIELIASGGTAAHLQKHDIPHKSVEDFAGIAEQLDGRVKTLHPKIHSGILALRDQKAHRDAVGDEGLIDLVIVNLYPFAKTISQTQVTLAEAIEQIDVGGVALLRAAAKNFSHVAVVSSPEQYDSVIEGLQEGKGAFAVSFSRELAVKTFALTSDYDNLIAKYLHTEAPESNSGVPDSSVIRVRARQKLRYGENPHQKGVWNIPESDTLWGLATVKQLQGKELSYNNLLDIDAALRCLLDFQDPTCAIIKHNSQCGLACGKTPGEAYRRAHECDPESAFGGIVGINRTIDAKLAQNLTETFLEVIVAPSVEPDAVKNFEKKRNLRVITLDWPKKAQIQQEWRQLLGSWLVQDGDDQLINESSSKVVTNREPTAKEREDLLFAWISAKHVKSNGIVIVHDRATVGIGQGQPSRVGSVRIALEKAGLRSQDAVAASDGFFPFADSIEVLAKAGVRAVIQPGGSIRDTEVIAAANTAGLAMLFTGTRHFRH